MTVGMKCIVLCVYIRQIYILCIDMYIHIAKNEFLLDYDEHLLEEVWEQFKTALKILAKFNLEKLLCTYAVVEALHCKVGLNSSGCVNL